MATLSVRKFAILALLSAGDGDTPSPLVGVTRFQKLLFLLSKQLPSRISADRELRFDIDFQPQKFGPADFGVYPDLDFLVATGHVSRSAVSPPQSNSTSASRPSMEEATEQRLSFAYLMGDEDDAAALAVTEGEEEQFELTQSGRELLSRLVASSPPNTRSLLESIETEATGVRRRFGAWPLQRLLRYVYSEYPDMTTASEIKERVLGHP